VYRDPSAKAELDALGLEVLPLVVQGDRHLVVGHVDQLREWLGLPEDAHAEYADLVAACERVLRAFEGLVAQIPDERLTDPTPNRGRDMRSMTVNVFSLMEVLITAMDTGHFSCQAHKEADAQSGRFRSGAELVAYAREIRERWSARARQVSRAEAERPVTTDRKGDMTQYLILDAGARHAAGHLRQAYQFLREIGIEPASELTAEAMAPIEIQTSLY
jgi:uncharacterized damage-inducible protein DinB